MQPRIITVPEKKLIGKKIKMSLSKNKTSELWRSFMPLRNTIINKVNNDLISMQAYAADMDLKDFNREFEKWATVEVNDFSNIPEGMETYTLPGGLYAVFDYKGLSTDTSIFYYIFGTWLPASDYVLDNRPHFEIMGAKYKNNDHESEEEICIPIRQK